MTCYLRHMDWLFDALELEYEASNRARLDAAIRAVFGLPVEAGCPIVWATIRALSEEERAALVPRVGERLSRG